MDWITHEEDVWFDFRGSSPDQLVAGRYYRGTVDGFADFGVFVDLADGVTGLLHRSETDRRIESLDWDPGDTVFVQVKGIRDNGNIDLAWSIRQDESEFRGARVHDPEGDADGEPIADDSDDAGSVADNGEPVRHVPTQQSDGEPGDEESDIAGTDGGAAPTPSTGAGDASRSQTTAPAGSEAESVAEQSSGDPEPDRVPIDGLDDRVGDRVRLEAEVTDLRQTSGPTVFTLQDESGTVDCAAFVDPGVRAYPEATVEDAVRLDGEVERRRGELQVETESLSILDGDEETAVSSRLADALDDRAAAGEVDTLAGHPPVEALRSAVGTAATAIRRAVFDSRSVVVRHPATADGYVAGAAIERAVLPLIRAEHEEAEAPYHHFDRRPMDEPVYGMDPATKDVTRMLDDRERFGERLPLFVLVGVGGAESMDGLSLLGVYGADRLVVDDQPADGSVVETAETVLAPDERATDLTTGALAATLATGINDDPDVREAVSHLPATSYWTSPPQAYVTLAAEQGYDEAAVRRLREAIALEAYYQSYEDKRELIDDILFGDGGATDGLAAHVSEQFREKLDREMETAMANLERREAGGVAIAVLDAEAYTHQYDFPPTALLVDELHRGHAAEDGGATAVTVALETDELYVRSTGDVDVRAAAAAAADEVPGAGVEPVGAREGRIAFLAGEREAVVEAVIRAVVEQVE